MSSLIVPTLLAAGLTAYPVYGDSGLVNRQIASVPHVEASVDRGPISELIVRCQSGTAIISYSKIEKLFCAPDQTCDRDLRQIARHACGS